MLFPKTGHTILPERSRMSDAQPPFSRIPFELSQIGFCSDQLFPLSTDRKSLIVVDQRSSTTVQPLSSSSPDGKASRPGACICLSSSRASLQVLPPSSLVRVQVLYSPLKSTRVV